ncbi:chorismate synthase, partial [Candidatus Peregrinibacteria bacterium]|nr:chorismate synthase [Candidatus Peregrinibacteria bacterium]
AKEAGDSIGGIIEVIIKNTPAGLGEPVFNKLNADLSRALMSIPSARGIEFGDGFALASLRGSENKHDSGILGGISTGQDIKIRLAFKPTSSTPLNGVEGRHDPCVVPRALPIAEAMVALVLADHYLMQKRNA